MTALALRERQLDQDAEMTRIEEHASDCLGAVQLNDSFVIDAVSDGVIEISGHDRQALLGTSGFDLIHPDDLERAGEAILELARTQSPTVDGIYRMRYPDDSYHDYAVRAVTENLDGTVKTIMKFAAVSDVLRAEEFARDTVDALRMLGEGPKLDECLERVHRLCERHVPGTRLAISTIQNGETTTHQRRPDRSFAWSPSAPELPVHVERALAQHQQGPWRAFSRMAVLDSTSDGARITSVLTDDSDELLGYVEAFRSLDTVRHEREWMVHGLVRQVLTAVLRRMRLDEQLRRAADHDPLTGLANRRRLFKDMADCEDLSGTSLLLIDLDRFSWINNNLGHHVGDQALKTLADRLCELCPAAATVARFGGDEFVVWSPTALSEFVELGDALRSAGTMPEGTADRRASVRCSIGAIAIIAGESAADAIKRADAAMYVAKSSGGDRVHFA